MPVFVPDDPGANIPCLLAGSLFLRSVLRMSGIDSKLVRKIEQLLMSSSQWRHYELVWKKFDEFDMSSSPMNVQHVLLNS